MWNFNLRLGLGSFPALMWGGHEAILNILRLPILAFLGPVTGTSSVLPPPYYSGNPPREWIYTRRPPPTYREDEAKKRSNMLICNALSIDH